MSKRSVQVNTFFPKRIFAPDIWGAKTQEEVDVEYDEYNIISKFAAKTIPSVNSFTTREQRYSSTQENDFTYVGNFLDDNQRYVKDSVNTNNSAFQHYGFGINTCVFSERMKPHIAYSYSH